MKNPLTPAEIEPATFWFVAQHLNHCATATSMLLDFIIECFLWCAIWRLRNTWQGKSSNRDSVLCEVRDQAEKNNTLQTQAMSTIDSEAVEHSRPLVHYNAETYRNSNTANDPYAQRTFPDCSPFTSGKRPGSTFKAQQDLVLCSVHFLLRTASYQ